MTPNPTTKGMSEAEVLAKLDSTAKVCREYLHPDYANDLLAARSTIESTFADRTALLEVVRRLLPYAREAFEFQASEQAARNDVRDAEAILSRITAPEASR